jgi:SagB-type dehydrogenase family enzyme
MRRTPAAAAVAVAGLILTVVAMQIQGQPTSPTAPAAPIALPSPRPSGLLSLEEALAQRRSVREFASVPLSASDVGQLLWAAQGVTDAEGRRTAPSAGALYSLEVYAVTADGTFRYLPAEHALQRAGSADVRSALGAAAFDQAAVAEAPLVIAVTAVLERTRAKYGARAARYVHFEAGHAVQNVLLQAVALGLGAVPVGAFDDERVSDVLALPDDESPLYLVPVGRPR